jgi:hypothetical protein
VSRKARGGDTRISSPRLRLPVHEKTTGGNHGSHCAA